MKQYSKDIQESVRANTAAIKRKIGRRHCPKEIKTMIARKRRLGLARQQTQDPDDETSSIN